MKIGIVTLANGHYIKGAEVLFKSIRKNTIGEYDLIHISDEEENLNLDNIIEIKIDNKILLNTNDRFKQTTKKLKALELVEYDRLIIMDSDMLCINDFSYLFSEEINVCDFLATKDLAANTYYSEKFSSIGLDKNIIFNTGLMIWNKPLIGKDNFIKLMKQLDGCQTYDGGDQGYLNHWAQKHNINIGYISYIYNHPLDNHWPNININETCILHYTNPSIKPWQDEYPESKEKYIWNIYKNE